MKVLRVDGDFVVEEVVQGEVFVGGDGEVVRVEGGRKGRSSGVEVRGEGKVGEIVGELCCGFMQRVSFWVLSWV